MAWLLAVWDEGETFQSSDGDWYTYLIRYGSWSNRFAGARPWGLQLIELRSRSDV